MSEHSIPWNSVPWLIWWIITFPMKGLQLGWAISHCGTNPYHLILIYYLVPGVHRTYSHVNRDGRKLKALNSYSRIASLCSTHSSFNPDQPARCPYRGDGLHREWVINWILWTWRLDYHNQTAETPIHCWLFEVPKMTCERPPIDIPSGYLT